MQFLDQPDQGKPRKLYFLNALQGNSHFHYDFRDCDCNSRITIE